MSTFYKIDSSRFSFREYWWGTPSPLVIFGWLGKVLGAKVSASMDDPPVEALYPHEVSWENLPEEVRTRFTPLVEELTGLGFHSPVYHAINDRFHNTRIYWGSFAHASGQVFGRIHHRIWSTPHPARVYLFPVFVSAFTDGTFLVSSAGKADSEPPRTVRTNRKRNATATQLWESHQQELARMGTKQPYSTQTAEDVRSVAELYHVALRDYHLQRKAFRPMTEAEVQQTAKMEEIVQSCAAGGLQHAEVLSEMYKLQNASKAGWTNAILVLVISMLVFLGAGSSQWSWKFALALIPILLFHELGHYVAMRAFKYRNLRMFFIPFFGAAVSGQNYNVPGWKKALVSLMGPVPGIIVGAVAGCVGLILHKVFLVKAAFLTLILNGFNLLPVLPLDGGWAMHAILFSRHYALDMAFRGLAGAALLVGGWLSHDRILIFLGVFMLIGIPIASRVGRIATNLRRRGVPAPSPDDQTVPPETAQLIISDLKTAFPKGMNNKTLAQHALNIFESLNARPPGWLASLALLAVHGISFLMALVFGIMFVVGQYGDVGGFMKLAAQLPTTKLPCGPVAVRAATETNSSASHSTIVANFPNAGDAKKAFDGLSSQLPATATLKLFGQALLVELPAGDDAARKRSVAKVQLQTTNLFVDSTNFHANLTLACVAATDAAAKAIEAEAKEYFAADSLYLVPPWEVGDKRSVADRAQHSLARRTYAKLLRTGTVYKEPTLVALQKEILGAQRQGDPAEAKRLREEYTRQAEKLKMQQLEVLKQDNSVDRSLIDLYLALPKPSWTNSEYRNALRQFGTHLGQLPLEGEVPVVGADRYLVYWGSVSREGLLLSFHLSFQRIAEGAPAVANWLCGKGCVDLKYRFRSSFGEFAEE